MKQQNGKFIGARFSPEEHAAFVAEAQAAGRSLRAHLHWKTRHALVQAGLLPAPSLKKKRGPKAGTKAAEAGSAKAPGAAAGKGGAA